MSGQTKKTLASREVPETTVLLLTSRILGPPLPGQGWLAGLTPSLDAGAILHSDSATTIYFGD